VRRRHIGFSTFASQEPPQEFLIWAYGVVSFQWALGTGMDFIFTREDADEVVRRANSKMTELPIDYEHRTQAPVDNGAVPAAGWFQLEARDDGLWATNVRWTEAAAEMIRGGEYRHWSPVFWDEGGHLRQLDMIGLTNQPATVQQTPLVASANGDPMREKLIKQLGLADDATDEQIEAALLDVQARAGQFKQAQSLLTEAGITAAIGSDEAAGQAIAATANAQAAARVAELEAENAELRTGQTAANAEALVETALTDGKILASSKAYWLEQATKNPKAAKAHFASLKPGATLPTEAARGGQKHLASNGLTETERQVIAQTGTSPEAFLATKKKLEEVRNAGA
jgi:phage I-like protein